MTANHDSVTAAAGRSRLGRLIGSLRRRPNPAQVPASEPGPSDAALVAASPLFDGDWYKTRYTDVARAGFDPAQHYAEFGEAEGREAGPAFSAAVYARRHPEAAGSGLLLLHAERHGQGEDGRSPVAAVDIDTLLADRFPELQPLPVFAVPHAGRRLSVVVDGLDPATLRHGAGAAIIVAALTARRIGATLRIVTRHDPSDPGNVAALLDDQAIEWPGDIDFVHAPSAGAMHGVPVGAGDLFISTSWQTAWATRGSVPRACIAYLVHEDERRRYPAGDDRLRCCEILDDGGLLYLAGSDTLLRTLQADGLAPGGIAIGSAEAAPRVSQTTADGTRRRFLLDASPSIPASLYWRGLQAVGHAVETGVLDPATWDICLAGSDVHEVTLPGGARASVLERLGWTDYVAALRSMDLTLRLADPVDGVEVAPAGGGVVCGGPTDPSLVSLAAALRHGVQRALERPRAAATVTPPDDGLRWQRATSAAIDRLARWAER